MAARKSAPASPEPPPPPAPTFIAAPAPASSTSPGLIVSILGLVLVGAGVLVGILGAASQSGTAILVAIFLLIGGGIFAGWGARMHRATRAP